MATDIGVKFGGHSRKSLEAIFSKRDIHVGVQVSLSFSV